MKRVIITILAVTLLTGLAANSSGQQVPVVGGYQEFDKAAPEAAWAARFARWEQSRDRGQAPATLEVQVYLVAPGDNGKTGKKIGCDDSLVPVTRTIKAAGAPLRASIEELLALPREYDEHLKNYWFGEGLKVKDVSLRGGVATIRITGQLSVAGVCDEPRIESQINETARQFRTVRKVKVFVNGRTLAQAIR